MLTPSKISLAVLLVLGGGGTLAQQAPDPAASAVEPAAAASASEPAAAPAEPAASAAEPAAAAKPAAKGKVQQLDRVLVTGSSIRRINAEKSLPVQVLKKDDIAKTGATSTVDLLQKLPAVQNSFQESGAEGGESGGFASVSVHGIGDTRTLVLLNGHRLAQFGGQQITGFAAGFDLNAIPIAAIERVEILTDGASALYGADAIAGVVNFITKRDSTDGDATIGYSMPKDGAKEFRISATKGWGSVEDDGYNFRLSAGHDQRSALSSVDRSFADTGQRYFTLNGQNYRILQGSASPIPANVLNDNSELVNPVLLDPKNTTHTCPAKSFRITAPWTGDDGKQYTDDYCAFDYVSTLQIYPQRARDNLMFSLDKKIADQTLFADIFWGRSTETTRIAPVPGQIPVAAGTSLFNSYLAPLGITQDTTAYYRFYDLGPRTNYDTATFGDIALGSRGTLAGWDYTAAYTHSESHSKSNISGYPGALAVVNLAKSGLLDPFVGPGQQSAAAEAAIKGIDYDGYWNGGTSKLDTASLRGSREIAQLDAGPLMFGTGFNVQREQYTADPSLFAQGVLSDPVAGTLCDATLGNCDQRFGDQAAYKAYSASRRVFGAFGEFVIPVAKTLELDASGRYDHYSDFGSAATFKGSFKWTPEKSLLVRGSVGTGYHAPSLPQVAATPQSFGVTTSKYTCSTEMAAIAGSLGAVCRPGSQQYDVIAAGNHDLQPEKSRQATLGLRFEPNGSFSAGADLWYVRINDQFGQLTEDVVFADPNAYKTSWTTLKDVGTGKTYLAFLQDNRNLGGANYTGIDFDVAGKFALGPGELRSHFTATRMLKADQQLDKNGPYYDTIGQFGPVGTVTFNWQGSLANTFAVGNWAHTLTVNFKSGYLDKTTAVDVLDAAGNVTGAANISYPVKRYYTFDWQSQWAATKNLSLTFGALNLLNRDPPFAISEGGVNRGQEYGYDDRYYDARGRTLYANVSYKF